MLGTILFRYIQCLQFNTVEIPYEALISVISVSANLHDDVLVIKISEKKERKMRNSLKTN